MEYMLVLFALYMHAADKQAVNKTNEKYSNRSCRIQCMFNGFFVLLCMIMHAER